MKVEGQLCSVFCGKGCGGCPAGGGAPSVACPGNGCGQCRGAAGAGAGAGAGLGPGAALPKLVIFAGGDIRDEAAVARWTGGADLVVAADSGLGRAFACGLTPDALVGDLDSAAPADVEAARRAGVAMLTVNPVKDETDLELAVEYGLARLGIPAGVQLDLPAAPGDPSPSALPSLPDPSGPIAHIILAGITGGRLDHTLAAFGLMARLSRQGHCVEAGDGVAWATILGGRRLAIQLRGHPGEYLSLIPLLSDVTGVTLSGFKYPLTKATLPWGKSVGVSNEFATPQALVQIDGGWLLVVKPGSVPPAHE